MLYVLFFFSFMFYALVFRVMFIDVVFEGIIRCRGIYGAQAGNFTRALALAVEGNVS